MPTNIYYRLYIKKNRLQDAWNLNYNEIFSPYSNPNTKDWGSNESNIFIYYYAKNGNEADFKIYKVGENNYDLDAILEATLPSKPMGLKLEYTDCENEMRYPKLIWNQNTEPDMIDNSGQYPVEHYKIYRAYSAMEIVPGDFNMIADIYIDASIQQPYYIDYNTYGRCGGLNAQTNYRVRYKIKAVDITSWPSVYSDFVSTSTYELHRDGDFVNGNQLPKIYSLSQNYPNPFNPVTNVKYSIANQGFVTLKIYDILGREIKTLVNELKNPGEYIVQFNGTEFASGIYFYQLKAGNFVQVKRMILLK